MRVRILIAAAFITSGWLAACSTPASQNGQNNPNRAKGGRDLRLVETPSVEATATVSYLEARIPPKPSMPKKADGKAPPVTSEDKAEHDRAIVIAAAMAQMSKTTISTAAAPQVLAVAPLPIAPTLAIGRPSTGEVANDQPSFGSRGPVIIIRGGRGGPDDDCDLRGHRPAGAINTVLPPLGGGRSLDGPRRSGFPRGGIH